MRCNFSEGGIRMKRHSIGREASLEKGVACDRSYETPPIRHKTGPTHSNRYYLTKNRILQIDRSVGIAISKSHPQRVLIRSSMNLDRMFDVLLLLLQTLLRPGEVGDGDDEETMQETMLVHISIMGGASDVDRDSWEWVVGSCSSGKNNNEKIRAHLLELSAIPAIALYHAINAAMRPNQPPAFSQEELIAPAES